MERTVDNCPQCQGDSRVVETRPARHHVRRRRECVVCGYRWTTKETSVKEEHDEHICRVT